MKANTKVLDQVPEDKPPDDKRLTDLRLGQLLIAEGLITEEQLDRALEAQLVSPAPLGTVLVSHGALQEDRLTGVLSVHLQVPLADLKHGDVDAEAARLIPQDFARRNYVLPVRHENGHLAVAMSDPTNLLACCRVPGVPPQEKWFLRCVADDWLTGCWITGPA